MSIIDFFSIIDSSDWNKLQHIYIELNKKKEISVDWFLNSFTWVIKIYWNWFYKIHDSTRAAFMHALNIVRIYNVFANGAGNIFKHFHRSCRRHRRPRL